MRCKVCGCSYEVCTRIDLNDGYYHWQADTCSYRCARKYAEQQVMAAEAKKVSKPKKSEPVKVAEGDK